jgi:hypothetical protein
MLTQSNNSQNSTSIDEKRRTTARRIAEKHGLQGRAVNTWSTMAQELLEELQPAIEEQARTAADQAAKTRLRAVLELPEAKGREDLAKNLALDTDSTVQQIQAILASTPKQTHDPLAAAMRGRSPGISSDDGSPDEFTEADEEERAAQAILNA